MAECKIVIADKKTGKCYQKSLDASAFLGRKIGEKISGEVLGLAEYELEIRGGSDFAGFPMRKNIEGQGRKRALLSYGLGMRQQGAGLRRRKTVCGNTIAPTAAQVNLIVTKYGPQSLEDTFGKTEQKTE